MNKLNIALILVLITSGCSQSAGQMSESRFTKTYLKALRQQYPETQFKIVGELKIEAEFNEQTTTHFLDNAYTSYINQPSDLDNILSTYSQAAGDLFTTSDLLDTTRIVPIIKDNLYLEEVKRLTKSDTLNLVYKRLNEELVILFAEDSDNSISYFDVAKLERSALRGDLLSLAVSNLEGSLPEIEKFGEKPLYMLTAGGNYEASLILLDFIWTKANFDVDGDFVISIPSRDLLLVTGSDSPEGLRKMKEITDETVRTGNYVISADFFRRTAGSWEKFAYR